MALPIDKLGEKSAPTITVIDRARAQLYAQATNDGNPTYQGATAGAPGAFAPPVFGVIPAFDAMSAIVVSLVPAESLLMVVHGEQDMHFLRPLVPGMTLETVGEAYCVRVSGSGTRLTVRIVCTDRSDGAAVMEQYATVFIRGMSDGEAGGPDKPDHSFPESARASAVGEFSVHVDDDQTYRYSEASGDTMPIHLDESIARSVGLPGIIAHGLCTMAMTSQAILTLTAQGDPSRLKRLAVRFSKNVFPGNDVVTHVYDAGASAGSAAGGTGGRRLYAFETVSAGEDVIKNGWAEIDA